MNAEMLPPTIWHRAIALFGSEIKAAQWMTTRLPELEQRTPEEVLKQDPDAVKAIFDRIEFGGVLA